MRIAHVNLRLTESTRLHKLGPQVHSQLIRICARRTRRAARERHFEHDLRVDCPPGIGGVSVRDREDGLVGEELNLQDGTLRFGVFGVHGGVFVEGVDEGWGIEVLDASCEAGVGLSLGAHRRIEAETGGFEKIVPRKAVYDLDRGFEIEERFDEGHKLFHGAWVDGVENDNLLLIGQEVVQALQNMGRVRKVTYKLSGCVISNITNQGELRGKRS